jgi:hypothetical protein
VKVVRLLAIRAALATGACAQAAPVPPRLTPDAGARLAVLQKHADRCLAGKPTSPECACPPGYEGGCYVGNGFVAYDSSLLPIVGVGGDEGVLPMSGIGLAYVPSGVPPGSDDYEFYLNGYVAVGRELAGAGPRWFWTSICRICD